jgi:hypothetical protein
MNAFRRGASSSENNILPICGVDCKTCQRLPCDAAQTITAVRVGLLKDAVVCLSTRLLRRASRNFWKWSVRMNFP